MESRGAPPRILFAACTWGKVINEGRGSLDEAPHISLVPCAVMFATLLSLNYIGDRLRSRFDVRESGV